MQKTRRKVRQTMRNIFWALAMLALTLAAFWVVLGSWNPKNPLVLFLLAALFIIPNIGTIWMLYTSIRCERHPLPFILLAFVPYAFLWYYFERTKQGKHLTRHET